MSILSGYGRRGETQYIVVDETDRPKVSRIANINIIPNYPYDLRNQNELSNKLFAPRSPSYT